MPKVPISKLKAGMKLSKPVLNDSGMIMIGENTELTDSLISRMERMNIESVSVIAEAAEGKSQEELLAELDARFRKTINEPGMSQLKTLFEEQIKGAVQ